MRAKILMVVFVLVLGTILTAALVAVNYLTTPVIQKNEELTIKSHVLHALGIEFSEDAVEQLFGQNIEEKQLRGKTYYLAKDKNIAFAFSGSGLWGPINGIIAVKPDLTTLKAITIIHQEETPGLGSRITEKPYLDQFHEKNIGSGLKLVPPGKASQPNEIDGITGATMTSNAFIAILNGNLKEYLPAIREGEKQ